MEKKKPTVLPGLVNVDTKPKVLAGIKKAADNFKGSALPIMKYFSDVKPSRNEKIIKPDMTPGGKVINQDLPTIREALKPGFSSNFTTNYTLPPSGPVNTVAPAISGTVERSETLTSTTGTWTGTGTITYAYQWKRDGLSISGATSSTYVLVAADDNANITCLVTATDDEGSDTQLSNTLGPVLGLPYLLSAPVASGTAQVGQTLSTTNGSWQGVATITFGYQWRRDTVDITSATSSTYALVAADYSTDVDCVVTATNSLGNANTDSNDIANIAGTTPAISGVPTISSQTEVGQTITATPASVAGAPTPTTSWQWERSSDGATGWANISAATASTYTLVAADDTKYARAVQTETNVVGSDTANSASSGQVSGYDADAAAYFTAASITDTTEKDAVDQLVKDLKGTGSTTNNNNIWASMQAIYPVSPTSLSAAAFNLKNTSLYEITWFNSPSHATTGITGNGTTQYGDTGAVMGTILSDEDDSGMTYSGDYASGDYPMGATAISMGTWGIRTTSNKRHGYLGLSSAVVSGGSGGAGIYSAVRRSTTDKELYKNGASVATNTTSDTGNFPSTQNLYVLGLNNNGSAGAFFAGEIDFWAVHTALTAGEAQDLYDAITTYNTALSR